MKRPTLPVLLFILISLTSFQGAAQSTVRNALELAELLGKNLGDTQIRRYMGSDIKTVRLNNWALSAEEKGMKIRAVYDYTRTDYLGKIYSIELHFSKKGMQPYQGELPFDITHDKTLKKCHVLLRKNPDIENLEIQDTRIGKSLVFTSKVNELTIFFELLFQGSASLLTFKMGIPP